MFKANNKNNRTTPLASFWCLYCLRCTYFTPCSSVSNVNFEHVLPAATYVEFIHLGTDGGFTQVSESFPQYRAYIINDKISSWQDFLQTIKALFHLLLRRFLIKHVASYYDIPSRLKKKVGLTLKRDFHESNIS